VAIALEPGAESIVLRIADDGKGFDGGAAPDGHGGLRGMRERALLVGGALAIKPGSAGGVEVRLEVPARPVEVPIAVGA
jgi:signal transduction histidine kinase